MKRICALLLIIAILVPFAAFGSVKAASAYGDVDGDGDITSTDARLVLQYYAKKIDESALNTAPADVDGDGDVTSTDARLILQYYAKKITEFPAGEFLDTSLSPAGKEAGTAFENLSDLPENAPAVINDATAAFGYFALTVGQNPQLPFSLACHVTENAITAVLPAGADLSRLIPTFTYYGDCVTCNGAALISDETVLDATAPLTLTLTAKDGTAHDVTLTVQTPDTGLPSLAVGLADATVDDIDHELYTAASFYLGGYEAAEPLTVSGQIKGRGNSSWLLDEKKSYTVKLDKKTAMLDMAASKNWALVGNYEDKSLMRNLMAEYFATAAGVPYVMKARPVDLWVNGAYWGVYNLTEKIEIEPDRVNITDCKSDKVYEPDEVGYLLEFDYHVMEGNAGGKLEDVYSLNPDKWEEYGWSRYAYTYHDLYADKDKTGYVYYNPDTDESFFAIPYMGKWATVKKPSTKNLTDDMRQYIYQRVMELDSALRNFKKAPQKIGEILDIDSFAPWVIVEELMDNTDSSFHSSVYMSLDKGGKFTMGPVWDFDRSSGNCSYWSYPVGNLCNFSWCGYLFATDAGRTALKTAWARFCENTADWGDDYDALYQKLCPGATYNFEKWDILETYVDYNSSATSLWCVTYDDQVSFLKAWLEQRYEELGNYIQRK